MAVDVITRFVFDIGRALRIFTEEIALGVDPLTTISFLFGSAFVGVSLLVFGYVALGAALNEVGIELPQPF